MNSLSYFCILEVEFAGWQRPHKVASPSYMELAALFREIYINPPAPINGPAFLHIHFPGLSPVTYKSTETGRFWRCSRMTREHLNKLSENEIGTEIGTEIAA